MLKKQDDFIKDVRTDMRGGKGDAVIEHILKDNMPANCRLVAKITLEPGCSIGYHVHTGETELFFMQKGIALINDNGTEVKAYPGDMLSTASGCGHSIENIGDETFEMTAVIILE